MSEITMKDMLLTTKDKLGELEKKLRQLKGLTYTECDKNIKEVRYVLLTSATENPELSCVVARNDKRIKGIINNLLVRRGLYVYGRESGLVLRDNNGNSHIDINEYSIGIPDYNQEKFKDISDELLNDEFVRKFLRGTFYFRNKKAKPAGLVTIAPDFINVKGCENLDSLLFNYYSLDKQFSLFNCSRNKISDENLIELLNMPLDSNHLSDYQTRFIESSPMRNKEIIVPRFSCENGHIDFDVKEDEKKFCLIKK